MAAIRGRNTAPELALRRLLHKAGIRYRVHARDVAGRPDIVHRRARVAVFIDGCFWHACPTHYREPATRVYYWRPKIQRNQDRRAHVLSDLNQQGWAVLQYWECSLRENSEKAAREIARAIKKRRTNRS